MFRFRWSFKDTKFNERKIFDEIDWFDYRFNWKQILRRGRGGGMEKKKFDRCSTIICQTIIIYRRVGGEREFFKKLIFENFSTQNHKIDLVFYLGPTFSFDELFLFILNRFVLITINLVFFSFLFRQTNHWQSLMMMMMLTTVMMIIIDDFVENNNGTTTK